MHELAERAGVSDRTLRHYHRIGLLLPDRIGENGYRYYGTRAVTRLQQILVLRDTGLGLQRIAEVLDGGPGPTSTDDEALAEQRRVLLAQRDAIEARIEALERTIEMRREGASTRSDVLLEGFNDRYEEEVVERWGSTAFEASNRWWHGKSLDEQRRWKAETEALLAEWRRLAESGCSPRDESAVRHADAHLAWFATIPGTPAHAGDTDATRAMVHGVADAYELDPAFHRTFGSEHAARFAAVALRARVDED